MRTSCAARWTPCGAAPRGFADVTTFGIQPYAAPSDPAGPALCAGVTRSLAPQIIAQGIADDAELGLDTLQERVAEQLRALDAVMLLPTVVGAWAAGPSTPERLLSGQPESASP